MYGLLISALNSTEKEPMFELFNSDLDLLTALLYAVIGIAVVLCVLLILVGLLTVFQKIFAAIGKSDSKKKKETVQVQSASVENDEETVAAIVAAITMIYAEESGTQEVAPFKIGRAHV